LKADVIVAIAAIIPLLKGQTGKVSGHPGRTSNCIGILILLLMRQASIQSKWELFMPDVYAFFLLTLLLA
jgi:hypothetical protein